MKVSPTHNNSVVSYSFIHVFSTHDEQTNRQRDHSATQIYLPAADVHVSSATVNTSPLNFSRIFSRHMVALILAWSIRVLTLGT